MSNCKYDGWGCATYILVAAVFFMMFMTSCEIESIKHQLDRIERAVESRSSR